MILPSTYASTLFLVVLSLICLGSWANTFKLSGKYRFELFYFDFAIGLIGAAALAAFTLGSLGFDGFSFLDDLLHAGKRQDFFALLSGIIFNLGNMLLMAAISIAGFAVAFPLSFGLAIVIDVVVNFVQDPQMNAPLLFFGAVLVLIAISITVVAYRSYKLSQIDELVRTGQLKSTRKVVSLKGVIVSLISGALLSAFLPLLEGSRGTDVGLGPYSSGFLFALGAFFSTFFYNLFFMNLPVTGVPLEILDYLRGNLKHHGLGILGGAVFYCGLLMSAIAGRAEGPAAISPAINYGLTQGAAVLAVLWGLFLWKEFGKAEGRIRAMLFVMLAFLICGVGMISAASLWTHA